VKPAAWPTLIPENGTVVTPTVTLDGGSAVTLPPIKVGEPIGVLPTPTKAGNTFDGWYIDDTKIGASFIVPATPFALVARWTISTNGGGSETPDPNNNGGGAGTPDPNDNGGGAGTPDPNDNGGGAGTPSGGNITPDTDRVQSGTPADQISVLSINTAKIAVIANQTYTGKALTPQVKVTLSGKTLVANTDYAVTYGSNTAIGKATVTVTGKGQYKDTASATFKIVPKTVSVASLKAGDKKFTLKWKKTLGVTKYQIAYKLSTAKSWKTVSVGAKATSKAVAKLKDGKRYQVRIRAYKTTGGAKYYSEWSKTKIVKVK
jgi:uncharacterized repeat protein (TIGR02543 family)